MMFVSLILAALVSTATAESAVLELTDESFDKQLDENKFALVMFYAPWCGHCKSLAPEWEAAAASLAGHDPKVLVAKVDATAQKQTAEVMEVSGFPTIKWFVDGEDHDYTGGRTAAEIVSWVDKKTGPPCDVLTTVEELEAFKAKADVVVVGVFATAAEGAAFDDAAVRSEAPFATATAPSAELVAAVAAASTPGVVVFKAFDEGRADFEGDCADKDAIAAFVDANVLPLIVPFSQETAPKIFGGKIEVHTLLFVDARKEEEMAAVLDAARPVAKARYGETVFVTVDVTDDRILEFFDVDGEADIPTVRMVKMNGEGMTKYSYEGGAITEQGLEAFIVSFFAGELSPQLKTEEAPAEPQPDGEVHTLVGTSFEAKVNAPGVAVFVEFYAPWCGHCKKLKPVWDELAAEFKGNSRVVIAKIDSTANELERVQVSGFPTLKFFPADTDEIVDYDGDRVLDKLVAFVESALAYP